MLGKKNYFKESISSHYRIQRKPHDAIIDWDSSPGAHITSDFTIYVLCTDIVLRADGLPVHKVKFAGAQTADNETQ